ERPSAQVWVSVAVSVVGVILIQQPHFAERNYATLIALVSSVFTALAMIGLHRLAWIDARAIVVHFSAVSLLFCLACFGLFERGPEVLTVPGGAVLGWLLVIGVTATAGQLFLTRAFAAGPPARVSVIGLSQFVFAIILEVLLLGRSYQAVTLVGMALVLAPTAWLM